MSTEEIYGLFSGMNQKTVSWHLNQEIAKGSIVRSFHGFYALAPSLPDTAERLAAIPELSRQCFSCLDSLGLPFYLSGLDCLNGLGLQVEGSYPVIVCTGKNNMKDIQMELMRSFDLAITEEETLLLEDEKLKGRISFMVLSSSDSRLQNAGFAYKEKAFVDLYYAVTRLDYPLSRAELPRILSLIDVNSYRFRLATRDRKLANELNFLLNYDSSFIKAFAEFI